MAPVDTQDAYPSTILDQLVETPQELARSLAVIGNVRQDFNQLSIGPGGEHPVSSLGVTHDSRKGLAQLFLEERAHMGP